jgi:hypothetical protein
MLTPSTVHAATITEVSSLIGTVPLIAAIAIEDHLAHVRRLQNLVVGETIYDVEFERGDILDVFGPFDTSSGTWTEAPMFWGDREGAGAAANAIMGALGDVKLTFRGEDMFAVVHGIWTEERHGDTYLAWEHWRDKDPQRDAEFLQRAFYTGGEFVDAEVYALESHLQLWASSDPFWPYIFAAFSKPTACEVAQRLGYECPGPVPEPGAVILLGTALVGLAWLRRKGRT